MLQDFSPELSIGFLNNIYPCHLDWHYNSFEIYEEAKLNILRHAEIQIVHGSFIETESIKKILHTAYPFGNKGNFIVTDNDIYYRDALFLERKYISLEGVHNLENIC